MLDAAPLASLQNDTNVEIITAFSHLQGYPLFHNLKSWL